MICVWSFIAAFLIAPSLEANNELSSPLNVTCACPNDHLIFNCTTVGSDGSTIWRVAAFDCIQNEIILRHSEFNMGGTSGLCNGGAINGSSIGVEGSCYISQLNVTVAPELHSRAVTCLLTSRGVLSTIGNVSIFIASEINQAGPSGVSLTDVGTNKLVLTWNLVDPNCPPHDHRIMFDCGTCTTTGTTATCTDLQIPSTCDFSVQNIVCGQVGSASAPVTVTLRVPNQPNVTIIPVYSADTNKIVRFNATVEQEVQSFDIVDGVSESVTMYNLSYSGTSVLKRFCGDSSCEYRVDDIPSVCSQLTSFSVSLSALNRLGSGPSSNAVVIGCMNNFVQVKYNTATSTITCRFMNQTNRRKSCSVAYGRCGQMQTDGIPQNTTGNSIILNVNSDELECYTVTASNGEVTVIVEGRLTNSVEINVTLIATVVSVVIIILIAFIATVLVIVAVMKWKEKRYPASSGTQTGSDENNYTPTPDTHLKIPNQPKQQKQSLMNSIFSPIVKLFSSNDTP